MGKLTSRERELAKSILAAMSIKRIADTDIIEEICRQTNKEISRISLYYLKQQVKRDSYNWYNKMREGQYEYIHEFKERIGEIMDLQRRHYAILDSPTEPTTVKQASMVELHKLSITLSNLYDVAPSIVNGATIPTTTQQTEATATAATKQEEERYFIV